MPHNLLDCSPALFGWLVSIADDMLSGAMAEREGITPKSGAFISHINAESPIAIVLQRFIREAYSDNFQVFVSSDKKSIPGGTGWWQLIRDSIKERQVVLLLLSDDSAKEQWINFEAGVGDGSGAKIIPVAIRNYNFGKLGFPLAGFQGRYVNDLPGILYDIDHHTGRSAGEINAADYLEAIRKAEDSVTYKSLLISPVRTAFEGNPVLMFEIENRGNVDIDLLFIEVHLPFQILAQNYTVHEAGPTLEVDNVWDVVRVRYYSVHNINRPGVRRLEPTITRSMGIRRLRDLRFPLKAVGDGLDLNAIIEYQVHGRDIDTAREQMHLCDIPVMPEKKQS